MNQLSDFESILKQAWIPSPEFIETTNMAWLMKQADAETYEELHAWSVHERERYWESVISRLGIQFSTPYDRVLDLSQGAEAPRWLPGATLNIADSCFSAPGDSIAILHQSEGGELKSMTVAELDAHSRRVASNLKREGFQPGDAIAIVMPMTADAIAIYLGIIRAGCAVIGIADSFQPKEIAVRLKLGHAKGVFIQDVTLRGGKSFPLYEKLLPEEQARAIVLPAGDAICLKLRDGDISWESFLQENPDEPSEIGAPEALSNILFSSGTTGDPKVIPWDHTTPIKCGGDAHFHQNIQPGDIVAWPTSLGWMMGPWLIYASLLNRATMAIFDGAPTGRSFGEFIARTNTTVLGVVPSLVSSWRNTNCLDGLDWTKIKAFSSTGECSCADDMAWLMAFAGNKPIVEYCGGTELAGAYIASTLTRPCPPGTFNTPILGIDMLILNEQGESADRGELFLTPPSIGMSTRLLNRDHHEIYYAGTPTGPAGQLLRRHGDQIRKFPGGYWRAQGRADDTMNLGGIKVSSAEIEQAVQVVPEIVETAAIAVAPNDGPSQLVLFAVVKKDVQATPEQLKTAMQTAIKQDLNPLFKISEVVIVDSLPRTASNKVMRRVLRDRYQAQ